MVAKGLLLFCLVGLSCATFLKKRQLTVVQPLPSVQTQLYRGYQEVPELHEYVAQPIVHRVHQNVHVEKHIQPVVHHIYKPPVERQTVENPVVPQEHVVQPAIPVAPEDRIVIPYASENQVIYRSQSQAQAQAQAQARAQAHAAI